MNEVLNNIKSRRSTRSFLDVPVKKEDIDLIIEAGRYAPSAMNGQKNLFTVITSKEKLDFLDNFVRETYAFLYEKHLKGEDIEESLIRKVDENYHFFYKAPAIVIVTNEKDNRNGKADVSVALQNMFLMAESIGLGTCWINQLCSLEKVDSIRKLLDSYGIPSNHFVGGVCAIGYIDKPTPIKPRKEGVVNYVD